MKKYLDKFWLAPALAIIVLAVLYAAGFGICTHATDLTAENGVVENATYFCYAVMFVFFIKVRKSFQTPFEKRALVMFWFFGIAAVLREAGIQHWLASCDTTAFKIRFFTNPDNPLSEKNRRVCFGGVGGGIVYLRHDAVAAARFQRIVQTVRRIVDGDYVFVLRRIVQNRGQNARQFGKARHYSESFGVLVRLFGNRRRGIGNDAADFGGCCVNAVSIG